MINCLWKVLYTYHRCPAGRNVDVDPGCMASVRSLQTTHVGIFERWWALLHHPKPDSYPFSVLIFHCEASGTVAAACCLAVETRDERD